MRLTLANQLTLVRIVAVVPLMIALYLPFDWARWVALAIYVAPSSPTTSTGSSPGDPTRLRVSAS